MWHTHRRSMDKYRVEKAGRYTEGRLVEQHPGNRLLRQGPSKLLLQDPVQPPGLIQVLPTTASVAAPYLNSMMWGSGLWIA